MALGEEFDSGMESQGGSAKDTTPEKKPAIDSDVDEEVLELTLFHSSPILLNKNLYVYVVHISFSRMKLYRKGCGVSRKCSRKPSEIRQLK